jgi:cell division inhibitor SepF
MSALRRAGVWLGLVEEDDDPRYEDARYNDGGYRTNYRGRDHDRRRYSEDFEDEDEEIEEPPAVPRTRARTDLRDRTSRIDRERHERPSRSSVREEMERIEAERAERERDDEQSATVRPITRTGVGASGALTYPTSESLALAPPLPAPARMAKPEDEQRYQITTLHPTTYREARTIGEHFRDGVPVIINLTEMDEGDARRLVDFAAGLAFGLRGTIERVTNRVFLLSPANVQVTAEDKAKIAEGGFFSQT